MTSMHATGRRAGAAVACVLVALVPTGCGNGDDGATTTTTTSATSTAGASTTTAAPAGPAGTAPLPKQGEPLAPGRHAVFLVGVDLGTMAVTVDVVQWLDGDAADAAYAEVTGDTGGAPNDFFVRNQSTELRSLPMQSPRVTVAWDGDTVAERSLQIHDLPDYLATRRAVGDDKPTFWITVASGAVVGLEEQYRP